MHLSEPPSFLNVHPLCQYTHFVYLFICQWTLGELTPLVVVNSAAMNRHGVHHFILNGTSPFASFSGPDPWKVACEVVCSGMHQLLQVLQQKWCLELRSVNVGSVFLWAEAISGELLVLHFLIIRPSEQISTRLSLQDPEKLQIWSPFLSLYLLRVQSWYDLSLF